MLSIVFGFLEKILWNKILRSDVTKLDVLYWTKVDKFSWKKKQQITACEIICV